jgi:dethiobiotin synthetase
MITLNHTLPTSYNIIRQKLTCKKLIINMLKNNRKY